MRLLHASSRRERTLLPFVVACVIGAGISAAQEKPPPWSPPAGPPAWPADAPPPRVCHPGAGTTRYGDDIFRDVYCHTLDKAVSFDWRNSVSVPPSYVVRTSTSERFATDSWPTFVRIVGDGNLFVAGKSIDGGAILEHWIFSNVSASGAHAPSVDVSCADGSDTRHYEWNLPVRSVDEVLHLKPAAPQGLIRGLFQNGKSRDKLFVYYDTTRELYSLDVNARSQTLVAGPAASSPMRVAALTNDYRRFWEADYKQHGFCYFFGNEPGVAYSLPIPELLVLIDSDRDGKIDSATIVSAKAWTTDGWGDIANIVQHDK